MAVLGSLVTMVGADTTGFTAGMTAAAEQAQTFEKKVTTSMQGAHASTNKFAGELEHLGGKFNSLHGLFAIGLGVHLGRQLFTELHHGLIEFGEGLAGAVRGEIGLGDAFGDVVRKAVGVKSVLEEITEAHKKAAEFADKQAESEEKFRELIHGKDQEFPAVKGGDESLADAHKRLTETRDAALAGRQKIADIKSNLPGDEEAGRMLPGTAGFFEALDKQREIQSSLEDAANAAEIAFRRRAEDLEQLNKDDAANQKEADETWKQYEAAQKEANDALKKQEEWFNERSKAEEELIKVIQKETDEAGASLKEDMEMADGVRQARLAAKKALENPQYTGGVSGPQDIYRELQQSALNATKDAAKFSEQQKQTQIFNDVKKAVESNRPLIYGNVV